ncbi:MAG TPA: sugar transferase [Tepidisphaeraceae bacterium]|jgi:lipopolysaccharide/colanic/teichoic acid biosynthesis glycosyltransferase
MIDLVGAACGLCAAAPLIAVAAVAIKLDSPGPVFYTQLRSGRHGQLFRVIKLRTMRVGTRPVVGAETRADDPRITRVGAFLRRTGLDELPQLICVLRGDMSLVGPRPLLAWENEQCDARQATRLHVRPGLTGLAQVNGRNRIDPADRLEWDARYVETMNLRLDLWIVLRTVTVVLGGRDAYHDPPLAPPHPRRRAARTPGTACAE